MNLADLLKPPYPNAVELDGRAIFALDDQAELYTTHLLTPMSAHGKRTFMLDFDTNVRDMLRLANENWDTRVLDRAIHLLMAYQECQRSLTLFDVA